VNHDDETPYVAGTLVDHHCHGLVLRDLDREEFEALMNEGAGAGRWTGSPFDSMLGLAIRRHCAPLLGLEPHTDAETYVMRRQALGHEEVTRRMLVAAGIDTFLVDTGFLPGEICSPAEVAALAGPAARAYEVLRLETTAQDLLTAGTPIGELMTAVGQRLTESEAIAAKSIAAYRCGLDLPGERPRELDVLVALNALRPDDSGAYRIAHPTVIAALAWTAIDARLPLQLHVGYGDSDVDLLRCDPLHLTPFLRATAAQGVPVLLLHNYPFHRHAAYLAQVFDHVFMDVGLAVHNTGALSRRVIEETLELVPFGKLLHSSDAFGLPELSLLGSLLFRRGLDGVLADLVDRDELTATDAARLGVMVSGGNARRAYGLEVTRR
jgi:predicted TIM-barrel fold metal-dependent hydrolase